MGWECIKDVGTGRREEEEEVKRIVRSLEQVVLMENLFLDKNVDVENRKGTAMGSYISGRLFIKAE